MELVKLRKPAEFTQYIKQKQPLRLDFEKKIAQQHKNEKEWYFNGFCEPCGKHTKFLMDWKYSDDVIPNFRERLVCQFCKLNSRQRFMVGFLKRLMTVNNNPIKDIYMLEQITDFYSFIKESFREVKIVGSEYLGSDKYSGMIIDGVRHEDVLNISFENDSFDIVISNDVFEHVPNIRKALEETCRILRKNGTCLISIPFYYGRNQTIQRAVFKNGNLEYLIDAVYHGNPLSEKGSLVFYDFGWDFLDLCKACGFRDAYMLGYYSYTNGYMGNGFQSVFVTEK